MPIILINLIHFLKDLGQIAPVDIKRHIFPDIIEETGNFLVCPKIILDDLVVAQEPSISRRIDETPHKSSIGCEVLGGMAIALLKSNKIEEQRAPEIVNCQDWNLEDAISEFDVQDAASPRWLELDSSLIELLRTLNQVKESASPPYFLLAIGDIAQTEQIKQMLAFFIVVILQHIHRSLHHVVEEPQGKLGQGGAIISGSNRQIK